MPRVKGAPPCLTVRTVINQHLTAGRAELSDRGMAKGGLANELLAKGFHLQCQFTMVLPMFLAL